MANKTKALTKAEERALQVGDYGEYAGVGFEHETADDVAIPFLTLLQKNSPQLDPAEEKYIEGAKLGDFINSVTGEVYGPTITFIPAYRTAREFVEWRDRTKGGGFIRTHDPNSRLVQKALEDAGTKFGKLKNPENEDHNLTETLQMFGLVEKDDGEFDPVVLSFWSTKLGAFKTWNTKRRAVVLKADDGRKVVPPLFAHRVKVDSFSDSRKKGRFQALRLQPAVNDDWYESLMPSDDPRFQAGAQLHEMVSSGEVRAAEDTEMQASGSEDDGAGAF